MDAEEPDSVLFGFSRTGGLEIGLLLVSAPFWWLDGDGKFTSVPMPEVSFSDSGI